MDEQSVTVSVAYSEYSCADGALVILVFMNGNGIENFTFLALNKSASLSFELPPGQYKNGLYQVTIFAISGGRGIVDSRIEFVDRVPIITAAATTTTTTTAITTPGMLILYGTTMNSDP